jgi:hypothetical protein
VRARVCRGAMPRDRDDIMRRPSAARAARVYAATTIPEVREELVRTAGLAIAVMRDQLEVGDQKEQVEAARVVLTAITSMARTVDKPGGELSRPERIAHLRKALANPDEELSEALALEGWTK